MHNSSNQLLTRLTPLLLGSAFLLLSLAHIRLMPAWPVYLAEVPMLLLFVVVAASFPKQWSLWAGVLGQHSSFVWGAGFFVFGTLATFVIGDVPTHSLGLVKSFVLFPVFLAILILLLVQRSRSSHLTLLKCWWWGLVASSIAGCLLFLEGILTYDGRLASLYSSPNQLAMLIAPGVLIGLFFVLEREDREWRLWYGIGTVLCFTTLLMTRSYAALGALLVASAFLLVPHWKPFLRRFWWMGLGVLGVIGLWGVTEIGSDKFQSLISFDERSSLSSRLMIWEAGWKIAADSFPWGIGIGQFQQVYLKYQPYFPPYLEWAVPEPHNLFLSLYLSSGLLGLSGVIFLFVQLSRRIINKLSESEISSLALTRLYGSLLLWILLVGLVDTPYFRNDQALVFWGVIALSFASLSLKQQPSTT